MLQRPHLVGLENDNDNYTRAQYTYHSRFIPEGVAEGSPIFHPDAHVLPNLLSYEEYCSRDMWEAPRRLIAVLSLISGVSDINPLVAFYDIHGR
jgi:hypothetical protein